MFEEEKLKEAKYFFNRMKIVKNNIEYFHYELSAFLSAASSILRYCLKKEQEKTGKQRWYNIHISANNILKFFWEKRYLTVHSDDSVISYFGDWTGKENIIELSEKYIIELERLIEDGREKGILT